MKGGRIPVALLLAGLRAVLLLAPGASRWHRGHSKGLSPATSDASSLGSLLRALAGFADEPELVWFHLRLLP